MLYTHDVNHVLSYSLNYNSVIVNFYEYYTKIIDNFTKRLAAKLIYSKIPLDARVHGHTVISMWSQWQVFKITQSIIV